MYEPQRLSGLSKRHTSFIFSIEVSCVGITVLFKRVCTNFCIHHAIVLRDGMPRVQLKLLEQPGQLTELTSFRPKLQCFSTWGQAIYW